MDDNQYWIRIWSIVSASLLALFAIILVHDAYESLLVTEMINKGTNPIEARCAFRGGNSNPDVMCIQYIATLKGQK